MYKNMVLIVLHCYFVKSPWNPTKYILFIYIAKWEMKVQKDRVTCWNTVAVWVVPRTKPVCCSPAPCSSPCPSQSALTGVFQSSFIAEAYFTQIWTHRLQIHALQSALFLYSLNGAVIRMIIYIFHNIKYYVFCEKISSLVVFFSFTKQNPFWNQQRLLTQSHFRINSL